MEDLAARGRRSERQQRAAQQHQGDTRG
jgi:hypothetical protein